MTECGIRTTEKWTSEAEVVSANWAKKTWIKGWPASILLWLLLSLIFGLAYTQSHLYNDNQNTKFLHGLAMGGLGLLKEDWLANTADPLPVFSGLVAFTYSFLGERFFYVYFALLMGIYAYSLMGIASTLYGMDRSPAKYLAYFTLILAVHSIWGQIFARKVLNFDPVILNYGLAGQYLLGLDFQNSSFGVFLLLSIHAFLQRHPVRAILWLSLACFIHSAYLFGGGLLTVAYLGSLWIENIRQMPHVAGPSRPFSFQHLLNAARQPFLLGALALALVSPLVLYNQAVLTSTSPTLSAQAIGILVHQRIPHHSLPGVWWNTGAAIQVGIMVAAMLLVYRTRLFPVMLVPFLGGAAATLVQIFSGSDSLAFLAPWRVSVILVPLSTCLLLAWPVSKLFDLLRRPVDAVLPLIVVVCLAAVVILAREGLTIQRGRFNRYEKQDVHEVMNYVRETKAPGQVYLIPPRDNQFDEFRTYTGAPAFINWKSHPYRDFEVMEWYRRNLLAKDFYNLDAEGACKTLDQIRAEDRVTHVVIDLGSDPNICDGMQETYHDQHYALYSLVSP